MGAETMDVVRSLELESEMLGALPIINRFLERLHIDDTLKRGLQHNNSRPCDVSPDLCLGVLLRNVILGRDPVYALKEWAAPFDPQLFCLQPDEIELLNDDRIGRALDLLFDADRASLMTHVVVRAIHEFELDLDQLHNDSTTVTFSGEYKDANGDLKHGKKTLTITHGHNKDHRPDLKQLLWILTVTSDGAVPVHYRSCDGNTTDDTTHIETWETLRQLVGSPKFLYVADCKLCTTTNLAHIASKHGRFLTVMPGSRREDMWFRKYIIDHEVPWEEVYRQPHPRRKDGPPLVWRMVESPKGSAEGFRIVWVWSSQKADQDKKAREATVEKAVQGIEELQTRLQGKRCRLHTEEEVTEDAEKIIKDAGAYGWLGYDIYGDVEVTYHQAKRGRPGPKTRYVRKEKIRFRVEWRTCDDRIRRDALSDGMFPLMTNCDEIPLKDLLDKYRYQPKLEKRHEQLKSVNNVAPVFLKSVARIEALLFIYFLALLVQALIERQIRRGMEAAGMKSLPIYPEGRQCKAPTSTRVLALFENLQCHHLLEDGVPVKTFNPQLTELQRRVLELADVPLGVYPGDG